MNAALFEPLLNNPNAVTLFIALVPLTFTATWTAIQYRYTLRDKRFNTYHELIQKLVNPSSIPGNQLYLDQQIAIVYELRNYRDYYPVSIRILNGLKENSKWQKNERMIAEIDLAISYMGGGQHCY